MPSHYLNQCWDIVNWTLKNKLQWNFNRNSNIFIQESEFESVVCEISAILSPPQCVNYTFCHSQILVGCSGPIVPVIPACENIRPDVYRSGSINNVRDDTIGPETMYDLITGIDGVEGVWQLTFLPFACICRAFNWKTRGDNTGWRLNPLYAKFVRGNKKNASTIHVIPPPWHDTGS